jgi:hypothetical protein
MIRSIPSHASVEDLEISGKGKEYHVYIKSDTS